MPTCRPRHVVLSVLVIVSLLLSLTPPVVYAQNNGPIYLPLIANGETFAATDLVFRTRVTVNTSAQWQDLTRLGVVILDKGADWALVLVDDAQLADLARLRFTPTDTNALETLAAANAVIASALQPLLAQAKTARQQLDALALAATAQAAATQTTTEHALFRARLAAATGQFEHDSQVFALRTSLRTALQGLDQTERSSLVAATSVDTDKDGLSDDQEGFWCTDSTKADSDGDGLSDGAEVAKLQDWMNNKLVFPPSSGKPFRSWPDQVNCIDGEYDSVPDLAEINELGLNPNLESTDRDQFDDGQELFGTTRCPGSGTGCGYGSLPPANTSGIVLFPEMPGWVKSPGNHPLVAALPLIDIDVDTSSFVLERITNITTKKGQMTQQQKNYSSTKTEGTSSGTTDTETWNDWHEASITTKALSEVQAAGLDQEYNPFDPCQDDIFDPTLFDICMRSKDKEVKGIKKTLNWVRDQTNSLVEQSKSFVNKQSQVLKDNLDWSWDKITNYVKLNSCNVGLDLGCEIDFDWNGQKFADPNTPLLQDIAHSLTNAMPNLTSDKKSAESITRFYPIQFPAPPFVPTKTETTGSSKGGSHAVSHTQYEEHALTEGEAFTTGEDWSTAVAEDSTHSADFWFTYQIKNRGLDYARTICEISFNIFIGEVQLPTYDVANDLAGDGCLHNFKPDTSVKRATRKIPLSLDQMRMIDTKTPIRIVVARYVLSTEDYYTSDAHSRDINVQIEDGDDDGDNLIDTYLIPTLKPGETVLQVLARYFRNPETDAKGNITAIWTPEYRSDTPKWCQSPRYPSDYSNKIVWCKHALSTADWWNVYTDGLGDSSDGFQGTFAVPGSTVLFRFNRDTDSDGFSDRTEVKLGSDPNDPVSFPRPELLAGLNSIHSSNKVTSTLSLLNTGLYDAYGIEAIMIAPNDSISITNNTVGGSGRVRALKQVIVGSSIQLPTTLPSPWAQSDHAQIGAGGYYTGTQDRTYTFTVACPNGGCEVGKGTWTLNWNDGTGNSGSLNFGTGYNSPTFKPVGNFGVTLALYSGKVNNTDNSFTVNARTPRDTFQYTINREPHTDPLVIVSYNDPQGNHRFMLPPAAMQLQSPTDNLHALTGTMLQNAGVEMVTSAPFQPGNNHLTLLVNNPAATPLTNAHLFVEFINISGTVVSEAPRQVNLASGPTAVPVDFSSNAFNPPYAADQDYIVMAFLTDYQGNILGTAGRPLSSFQADPSPKLTSDDASLNWDFGSVPQGTLLKHPLVLANTGFGRLYTYIPPTTGLTLDAATNATVGAADQSSYQLTLRTSDLPVGPYNRTMTLATSDMANPTRTLHVQGTVTAPPTDAPGGVLQRPLDVPVIVTGTHSAGEWVDFSYNLGSDPQSLQPVKVYSQDYGTLFGMGKYATDFGQGTVSADMFGDGRDGVMPESGNLDNDHGFGVGIVTSGAAGSTSIAVSDASNVARINPGDIVLIHQTQGNNAGCWEMNKAISDFGGGTATYQLEAALKCSYTSDGGTNHAQILRVPQYSTCNVTGTVTPIAAWNGSWGGIFAVMCNDKFKLTGLVDATGQGFRGGTSHITDSHLGGAGGEGITGYSGHGGGGNGPWEGTTPGGGGRSMTQDYFHTPAGASGFGTGGAGGGYTLGKEQDEGGGGGGGGGYIYGGGGGGGGADSNLSGGAGGLATSEIGGGGGGSGAHGGTGGASGGNSGSSGNNATYLGGVGGNTNLTGGGGNAGFESGAGGGGGGGGGGNYGIATLSNIFFGSGGGGGGGHEKLNQVGGTGGSGGGIVILFTKAIKIDGSIRADGVNGQSTSYPGAGGGGAGGSVYISTKYAELGDDLVTAISGNGGAAGTGGKGGSGSPGRIRSEFCTLTGTTNPPASTQKLNCYIVEQTDPNTARLSLPAAVNGSATYNVQFGRMITFTAASNQVTWLRVPVGMMSSAKLDLLVSGLAADANISLDVGNDGVVDWNGTFANNSTTTSPDLATAFNAYWTGHGAPATGTLDVPVRVTSSGSSQLLLTNLQVSSASSNLRYVSVPAQNYAKFLLDFTAGTSGAVVAALDVGDNGSIDWNSPAPGAAPMRWKTGDLSSALNAYLAGKSDEQLVPIRFYLSPSGAVALNDYAASVAAVTDLVASGINVGGGAVVAADATAMAIKQGDTVNVTAQLRNAGNVKSGPVTVAFFANAAGWGDWYIGSQFFPTIPVTGTVSAMVPWNTTGFSGTVPVKVVINPYKRVTESLYTNNSASTTANVLPPALPPVADFGAAPTSGNAPLTVQFTNTTTATLTALLWNFGDGTTGNAQKPSHTYSNPGVYTVTLTVTGPSGSDTKVRSRYITVGTPPPPAPTANFSATPTNGNAPLAVQFTDLSTGSVTGWQWSFGDGATATAQHPAHTYPVTGAYTVTLTASGPGGSNTLRRSAFVNVAAGQVRVDIPLAPSWNLVALPVQPANPAVDQVLASINGKYNLVYAYKGCDTADPWKKYDPAAPPFANDLTTLDRSMGLWVRMTTTATLSVTGLVPMSTSIPLCNGWNLVGYPVQQARAVGEALTPLNGCYSMVYGYVAADLADVWKKYDPSAPPFANDLTALNPGRGYWIKANQACTWVVNR